MMKRKVLFAALVASTLGALPIAASAERVIVVDTAPPAPRHEVIHERHGYVWAPGYWDRRHGEWVWVKGHYEREHHGKYWHPNRWEQRDGRWEFRRGEWRSERYAMGDRDHDGVPNRYDRDRDGDGVPNRFDRAPNNPNRH